MEITPAVVADEHAAIVAEAERYAAHVNEVRSALGAYFDEDVGTVDVGDFERAVDTVFADPDRGVNAAALCRLLRELDVTDDYPGFVVDEFLGRRLAATIAGGEPLTTLAEATFHFADIHLDDTGTTAGSDDLDAGIVAGVQTILPGWRWRSEPGPFDQSA